MKRPIILILASASVLLVAAIVNSIREKLPYPELIGELYPEVRLLAFVAFAAGLLGLLLDHNIERFEPIVERAFHKISNDVRQGVEGSLKTMNSTMETGFNEMAAAFAKEVRGASQQIWKGFSDIRVEEHLISSIQSPKLKALVRDNKITEAISEADRLYVRDQDEHQQKISLLLLSDNEENWSSALSMLEKDESLQKPEYFLTLAFRFWTVKKLDISIPLAEKGLGLAKDEKLVARFRNSLAYYYADADAADKETLAFEYAEAAVKARPNEAGPLDTLGFVKISFGKTREQVLEGAKLCAQAFERGTRFELYAKDVQKTQARLKTLPEN